MEERKIKVINSNLTKTGIIMASDFVDFKRKAGIELKMSGWFNVRVFNVKDFEVEYGCPYEENFTPHHRNLQLTWCPGDQGHP